MTSSDSGIGIRLILSSLLCLQASPVRADLSFVQIVQGQTSHGQDGVFGKTWVELKGHRMRLVSGFARKVREGMKEKDPRRVIQIIDLPAGERILLRPERKTYTKTRLAGIDYGHSIRRSLDRGAPEWHIDSRVITLSTKARTRRLLETDCRHYHLHMSMTLSGPGGRKVQARMDQHVWVAPVSGELSSNILDLIAFENDYRKKTGGALSPLDHERYQVREAAAYLRISEGELLPVVETVRERLRELPSYPVASSVSWWRDKETRPPGHERNEQEAVTDDAPPLQGAEDSRRSRRRRGSPPPMPPHHFKALNWGPSEQKINQMYSRTRRQVAGFPFGPLKPRPLPRMVRAAPAKTWPQEPAVYSKFEQELQSVLHLLIKEQEEGMTRVPQPPPDGQEPEKPSEERALNPFYEIYTEIHGLESASNLSRRNFSPPKDYKKVSSSSGKSFK